MNPTRIMVVDDQSLFREGLVWLLQSQPDMQVVAEASDGLEAVRKARQEKPDIILMDIRMPRMDGLEATRHIKAELPDVHVVMLTISDAERDLFNALKVGAIGYLLKNMSAESLFRKIRDVVQGETALSPTLASRVLEEFARLRRQQERSEGGLSDREREILRLVVEGRSNKEIAQALVISEATAKRHLHNILQKLHARNRAEAAVFGLRAGLVEEAPSPGEDERDPSS